MCQAYEGEARFVTAMERKYGRCEYGHLRFSDGMCSQGRLCLSNLEYFRDLTTRITQETQ